MTCPDCGGKLRPVVIVKVVAEVPEPDPEQEKLPAITTENTQETYYECDDCGEQWN